ncbi:MAG: crosslink repair DNA glycosylase YcaQ family protein [Acidimicrobiales bacterium]
MATTPTPVELTNAQARRIALGAQGFAERRPTGAVDRRHGRRLLDRVGVVQIDSVNVVVRSQELPLFARLGHHRRDLIPRLTEAGDLFEYWAHEASHVPVALHPLLRWRMAGAHDGRGTWGGVAAIACDSRRSWPPCSPRWPSGAHHHLDDRGRRRARRGHVGLEPGQAGTRVPVLERAGHGPPGRELRALVRPPRADAPGRRPRPAHARPARRQARPARARRPQPRGGHGARPRRLLPAQRARVPGAAGRPRRRRAPGAGRGAGLEGPRLPPPRRPSAQRPRPSAPVAVRLAGVGSDRTERIWGFRYRIEIYTPAAQRVHGYYVLPFLLDGDLVARVDLKADRAASTLLVRGAFAEARVHDDPAQLGRVAEELAGELGELARFLGLDGVEVAPNGDLAPALAATVADHP